ncbi:Berberine bridge enzyme-like 21, partial [Mucuna pruriens]
MAQILPDATPFPYRAGYLFKIQYSVSWSDPSPTVSQTLLHQANRLFTYMAPYVTQNPRSAFLNYRDLDIGVNSFGANSFQEGQVYGTKYFGANFDRLVKVKAAVDPDNIFRNEQSIPVRKKGVRNLAHRGMKFLKAKHGNKIVVDYAFKLKNHHDTFFVIEIELESISIA